MKWRTYKKRWSRYYDLESLITKRVHSAMGGKTARYYTAKETFNLYLAEVLLKEATRELNGTGTEGTTIGTGGVADSQELREDSEGRAESDEDV
jgi:hypothetical protein